MTDMSASIILARMFRPQRFCLNYIRGWTKRTL